MKKSARGDSSTGSELKDVEEARREASRTVEPCVLCASLVKPISDLRLLISGLCALLFALSFLGALLFALCPVAEAQQPTKVPRIGFLGLATKPSPLEEAFLQALRDLGYIDGQNVIIEYRWAAGKTDRLPALAEELVRLKVDLIVGGATPVIQALKNTTKTILLIAADPVGTGFVASLARPGGNITGMAAILPELAGKRLELLREVLPKLPRVAFLAHGGDPAHKLFVKEAQEAAERFRMKFLSVVIGGPEEFESAFSAMIKERTGALIVQPLFIGFLLQGRRIADLAARNRLPTISDVNQFAEEGGLMVYGPDRVALFRRAATYVDKILKGTKPADLPVEQPTKFELVIISKRRSKSASRSRRMCWQERIGS